MLYLFSAARFLCVHVRVACGALLLRGGRDNRTAAYPFRLLLVDLLEGELGGTVVPGLPGLGRRRLLALHLYLVEHKTL